MTYDAALTSPKLPLLYGKAGHTPALFTQRVSGD